MKIELIRYSDEQEIAIDLIIRFWKEHNDVNVSYEDANENLIEWTKEGHILYFISVDNEYVGFVHLGSRGCEIDWLEDIFVLPEYQNKGIGMVVSDLLSEIAYNEYNIEELIYTAKLENTQSQKSIEKLGGVFINSNDGYMFYKVDLLKKYEEGRKIK